MKEGFGRRIFHIINFVVLTSAALLCLLPIVNIIAVSLSSRAMVEANMVSFWPKAFTVNSYKYILDDPQFFTSLKNTLFRVGLGWALNISLTVLVAFPLSKEKNEFRLRGLYIGFFLVTMVFNGGMIPTYMVVSKIHLLNTIWALILPEAIQMFYVLLMINFFRGIPKGIEEAALVDGAGRATCLFRIFLPLSLPSLATVTLFIVVSHWNAWFDGLIYMNLPAQYPLMTYLRSVLTSFDAMLTNPNLAILNQNLDQMTSRSYHAALILMCTLPILISYPFLQKYFVSGIVMGSEKG